ncbi:MAG TPA: hypothetical protein VNO79_00915, partial [Actinomycetota bacterium]|nr:hypothetical protein [Actinomycetota bacterium]
LPPVPSLIEALLDGGVRLAYRSREERERLRQAVLRAARAAGLVAYTRARGEQGVLEARGVRDAAPDVPPTPPRPRPYRPADARAPSSRAFVEGGFSERALFGPPSRADVRAAAELAARVQVELEAEARPRQLEARRARWAS